MGYIYPLLNRGLVTEKKREEEGRMKIVQEEVLFQPVTITIETAEELKLLNKIVDTLEYCQDVKEYLSSEQQGLVAKLSGRFGELGL